MNAAMAFLRLMAQTARLMVGQTPYAAYREHMAAHHAEAEVMDEQTFFRHRQEARYGGKSGGRCC